MRKETKMAEVDTYYCEYCPRRSWLASDIERCEARHKCKHLNVKTVLDESIIYQECPDCYERVGKSVYLDELSGAELAAVFNFVTSSRRVCVPRPPRHMP